MAEDNTSYQLPQNNQQGALERQIADLRKELADTRASLKKAMTIADGKAAQALKEIEAIRRTHIEGPGHSGTINTGLMFDPRAADVSGGTSGGTWRTVQDCDGNSFDILARNTTS